jgi:hypothetical protein
MMGLLVAQNQPIPSHIFGQNQKSGHLSPFPGGDTYPIVLCLYGINKQAGLFQPAAEHLFFPHQQAGEKTATAHNHHFAQGDQHGMQHMALNVCKDQFKSGQGKFANCCQLHRRLFGPDPVADKVLASILHCFRVNVDGLNPSGAEADCCNGQNAAARSHVQTAVSRPQMFLQAA